MTGADVLAKAKELLADPSKWTRKALARTANGHEVPPSSEFACRFCALGAIAHITGEDNDRDGASDAYVRAEMALYEACRRMGVQISNGYSTYTAHSPVEVNDRGTHKDVIEMFERAHALQVERERAA